MSVLRVSWRSSARAALSAALALFAGAGCFKVDLTQVRVRDPGAIGVVGDEKNEWLLPPHGPPGLVEVYRTKLLTATLTRTPSGSLSYTSEHWALGTRLDTTPLTDEAGNTGWTGSASASQRFEERLRQGGPVRLRPVQWVTETGPFGTCNRDACVTTPPVKMSLATESQDIEEVRITRTPIRWLGIGELVLGSIAAGLASADEAVVVPTRSSDARNVAIGVGAGLLVLGGLVIADGLWRVLTPDQHFVYRPSLPR